MEWKTHNLIVCLSIPLIICWNIHYKAFSVSSGNINTTSNYRELYAFLSVLLLSTLSYLSLLFPFPLFSLLSWIINDGWQWFISLLMHCFLSVSLTLANCQCHNSAIIRHSIFHLNTCCFAQLSFIANIHLKTNKYNAVYYALLTVVLWLSIFKMWNLA